uniref:Uncharacterized protein n=1 Tax=Glossina palpalis gambiensis TaxID=67801 RepID=A0A1B0BJY7_9MUSC
MSDKSFNSKTFNSKCENQHKQQNDNYFKRGSDELLSQAAIMAPASDNNNQDLATKKAKLETSTVLGGVGTQVNLSIITVCLGEIKSSIGIGIDIVCNAVVVHLQSTVAIYYTSTEKSSTFRFL